MTDVPLPEPLPGLIDAMVRKDSEGVLSCFDPEGSFQDPSGHHPGRDALANFFGMAFALVDDITWPVHRAFRHADDLCFEWTFSYTLQMGRAAGRRVDVEGLSIITMRDGRILRWRDYWDALPILTSLGVSSWEELLAPG